MAAFTRAHGLLRAALLLSLFVGWTGAVTTYRLQGLLGGSINWAVDPHFADGPEHRYVTFVLNTTMVKSTSCVYTTGEKVSCSLPNTICGNDITCAIGELHGVLCVAQLVPGSGTDRIAKWAVTTGDEAQCVHDHILETDRSTVQPSSPAATDEYVGKVNTFTVDKVYDQDPNAEDEVRGTNSDRRPSGVNVVQGSLRHRVKVHEDAKEVVAWFAPRKGFQNFCKRTSMLLPACAGAETSVLSGSGIDRTYDLQKPNSACMANPLSLFRRDTDNFQNQNEQCSIFQGPALDPTFDDYWGSSQFGWKYSSGTAPCKNVQISGSGSQPVSGCMRPATPALETLVPLCTAVKCASEPPRNYYSPEVTMPHLIEVPITPKTLLQESWTFQAIDPNSVDAVKISSAPHPGFYVHSVDYDGHKMTQSSPLLKRDMKTTPTSLLNSGGVGRYGGKWGIGDSNSEGVTTRLSMRVDCVLSQTDPTLRWPLAETPTGCRELFDLDRDEENAKGNLLRADFSFGALVGRNNMDRIEKMFTQHVINTADFPFEDVDNTAEAAGAHIISKPTVQRGAAMTQNVFSMFGCYSGTRNQPPRFVTGPDSEDTNVKTIYSCNYWEECAITLHARDFVIDETGVEPTVSPSAGEFRLVQSSDRMSIRHAYTFAKFPESELSAENGCVGNGGVDCKFVLTDENSALFDSVDQSFKAEAVGKVYVRCFVAMDEHPEDDPTRKTCPSMPHCVKIKIEGLKPQFVEPTPLGPSYDDNGLLVPNRHDVPACEGYALPLVIRAEIKIPHDARVSALEREKAAVKPVRVFLEDKDVDTRLRSACPGFEDDKYLFHSEGGQGNPDFFCDAPLDLTAQERLNCGDFGPYLASQRGTNTGQRNIASITTPTGESKYKTVNSQYAPGIVYTEGAAEVEVIFFPKTDPDRNGITLRAECTSHDNPLEVNCREKLVNMDQVICASAYDSSREQFRMWVGERNPNGDDIFKWQRDHSNGDIASELHCWRVRIAAPPTFVTDPEGELTPFVNDAQTTWRDIVDTTGNRRAYKVVRFRVGSYKSLTFLAQDPNPGDSVEVLILADPGIPEGMQVSESKCIARTGDQAMCKAEDVISPSYPEEDWSATFKAGQAESRCSRAQREISWTPGPGVAGNEFKVCATARDDSSICFGKGPEMATARGWFGEQQCIIIEVQPIQMLFLLSEVLSTGDWVRKAYVGCETRVRVGVVDDVGEGGGEPYPVRAAVVGDPPVGTVARLEAEHPYLLAEGEELNAGGLVVTWTPRRGMEGQGFDLCVGAQDTLGILTAPQTHVCKGGSRHLHGCVHDSECGGGVCMPLCIRLDVQRCEYCIKGDDTLVYMMRQYGFETNWLRLWTLNSYQGAVDPAFLPGAIFPAANATGNAFIANPDVLRAGMNRIYVGPVYAASREDTLQSLAVRFRTTVRALMSMNPDVTGDEAFSAGMQQVCVAPCTTLQE